VLEPYTRRSRYANQGQRVVAGQRILQASRDPFLGWSRDQDGRGYAWRRLLDVKGSFVLGVMSPDELADYAETCGRSLARAHARSGDAIRQSAYLGPSDAFDAAVGSFAEAYAEQNERDYRALRAAAKSGRIEVETGV
jgi:Uncharacterized protein conserved in bacteria (DUF2252)